MAESRFKSGLRMVLCLRASMRGAVGGWRRFEGAGTASATRSPSSGSRGHVGEVGRGAGGGRGFGGWVGGAVGGGRRREGGAVVCGGRCGGGLCERWGLGGGRRARSADGEGGGGGGGACQGPDGPAGVGETLGEGRD